MSKPVRKAIVLAAGFGSRLDPLTRMVPKPLLPFHGKTMLERTFERLSNFGVSDILVNLHTHADQLFDYCRTYKNSSLRIQCSYEPKLLGTGGALRRAAWFCEGESFWVVNSDVAAELDHKPILQALRSRNTLAALWMIPDRGPRTVHMKREKILNFRGPAPGREDHVTFSGVQLVRPELLKYVPEVEGFSTIVGAYEEGIKDGWQVKGITVPGSRWADVGTPEQYLEALSEWKKKRKFQDVDSSVKRHPKSVVENSVVMAGARVGASGVIRNAIVGPGVEVNRPVERMVVSLESFIRSEERTELMKLGFNEKASVECLSPRGSERSFYRVFQGSRSVMLIRYNPERKENEEYAQQAGILHRAGLPVFKVHAHDSVNCFSVIEDLGKESLRDRLRSCSPKKKRALYNDAIELMDEFHQTSTRLAGKKKLRTMPAFTRSVYQYEHNLFLDHYLKDKDLSEKQSSAVQADLKRLMNRLLKLDRVVVHRDYQSTNLMLVKGSLRLIDFQGMRYGVAMYDLASLLQDPYVDMTAEEIEAGLDHYMSLKRLPVSASETFWLASAQRLIQATGAYGRLAKLPGCEHFHQHTSVALNRLNHAIEKSSLDLASLRFAVD